MELSIQRMRGSGKALTGTRSRDIKKIFAKYVFDFSRQFGFENAALKIFVDGWGSSLAQSNQAQKV
jgi:hypothetical protein